MPRSLKTYVSITLIIGLLFTNLVFVASATTATGGTASAPTVLTKIAGLVAQDATTAAFTLTTETNVIYSLTGNTKGLEAYVGKRVAAQGYVVNNPGIMLPIITTVKTFYVISYSPVQVPTPKPTITPKPTVTPKPSPSTIPVTIKMAGILSLSDDATYKYALTNEKGIVYFLTGKIDGIEAYLNQKLIVAGYVQPSVLNVDPTVIGVKPVFVVVAYQPAPAPTPTPTATVKPPVTIKLAGMLSLSDDATYKYALTTEQNMQYLLTGKIDGIEAYLNQKLIVAGYVQPSVFTNDTAVIRTKPVFVVVAYQPATIPKPTPTATTKPPVDLKLIGILSKSDNATYPFALTTEKNARYLLTGKTDGIDAYIDQKIVASGYMLPTMDASFIASNIFVVVEYMPMPTPTVKPPVNLKLTGVLTVSDDTAYAYTLTTEQNRKYYLTGKTDGMESYVDKKVIVSGYMQASPIVADKLVFVVVEYRLAPTPTPLPPSVMKMTGVVSLSDNATYKYVFTNEKGIKFLLTGNTDGMDQYIDQRLTVVGYLQSSLVAKAIIQSPVFVVKEYYPVTVTTPTPEPVATL